jgi:hypothetical protein
MAEMIYTYYPDMNLVYLKPVGDVVVDDILTYGHRLLELGHMVRNTVEYVDMSEMTNLQLDYLSSQKLIAMHRDWIKAGWHASGYYTPKAVQFGMIRMLATVIDSLEGATPNFMYPFREFVEIEDIRAFLDSKLRP